MGHWLVLVVLGGLAIVAGIVAILNPFPVSLLAVTIAAWAFLIIGVVQIIEAFRATAWSGRIWSLSIGLLALIAGVNLLGEPLAGMISLTVVLAIVFLVSGIVKLVAGWQVKASNLRFAILISGLASVFLGLIILTNFPLSAVTSLGILLGVELISDGVSALSLGWSRRASA